MQHRSLIDVLTSFAFFAFFATFAVSYSVTRAEDEKKPEAVPKISLEQFEKMRGEKDAVVLDVRTPEEFAAGHVPGAVNMPIAAADFDERVAKLDKEKKYLVHCAAGVRSERACKKMSGTVKQLFDFSGGMKEWKNAGKPVER
jgi:phage shock protein E